MIEDWVISLVVAWLPFIALGVVWVRHGRMIRKGLTTQDGRTIAQIVDDLAREMKRANDLLVAETQRRNGTAPSS